MPRVRGEEVIEEKSDIGHTIRDHGFHTHGPLRFRFTLARPERGCDLKVIQGSDDVPVAAQVRAKKRRPTSMMPARVRKNYQWIRSGMRSGVADRLLGSRRAADAKDVLRCRRKILARICH